MLMQSKEVGFCKAVSREAIEIIERMQHKPSTHILTKHEFCVGVDHPIITQALKANPDTCRKKYDVSKGKCRAKKYAMSVPTLKPQALREGWQLGQSG